MKWKKLRKLFCPDNGPVWMRSHASNVAVDISESGNPRIYFTTRNKENKSSIGYADFDFRNNFRLLNVSRKPALTYGKRGLFDDSGVTLSCILNFGSNKFLYYMGWNLGVTVPWRNSIGLAIYDTDKKIFKKYSDAPVMDRNEIDPFTLSYPFVIKERNRFRMWYGSNLRWGKQHKDMHHIIKYAESRDGINWLRNGRTAVEPVSRSEYAFSRPFVLKENGIYKMWYSFRGKFYRIGYAESKDGLKWLRKDEEAGIGVSESGWDSEMICYPYEFDYNGERYLLYNGNGFGKTGFGIAVLERD